MEKRFRSQLHSLFVERRRSSFQHQDSTRNSRDTCAASNHELCRVSNVSYFLLNAHPPTPKGPAPLGGEGPWGSGWGSLPSRSPITTSFRIFYVSSNFALHCTETRHSGTLPVQQDRTSRAATEAGKLRASREMHKRIKQASPERS